MPSFAPPISDTQPAPVVGLTLTVPASGGGFASEFPIQPYSNTVEVQLLNRSADPMLFSTIPLGLSLQFADITIPGSSSQPVPVVGDSVTFTGSIVATLTAAAGPRVPGTDTWSVDARATGTITVNAGLAVGDVVGLQTALGPPADVTELVGVVGPRVPGSLTFEVDANPVTQAANLATAMNDSAFSNSGRFSTALAAGNAVTVTAGFDSTKRGASGNTTAFTPNEKTGLGFVTRLAAPGALTTTDFTGGVNADGGQTQQDGSQVFNRNIDYAANLAEAMNDVTNSLVGLGYGQGNFPAANQVRFLKGTPGPAFPVALSENTGGTRIQVTTPTGGAVTNPRNLTAADSMVILPGERVILRIGAEGERSPLGTFFRWANCPGANLGLAAQAESGPGGDLNITYIQGPGYVKNS